MNDDFEKVFSWSYEFGYEARFAGNSLADNPYYDSNGVEYNNWCDGWLDAHDILHARENT